MHGLVAQDVLVLLSSPSHLVLPSECQNLGKANIKKQTFHKAGKNDQGFEQSLVVLQGASFERRIHDGLDEWDQKFVFVSDRLHFVVGVKDLAFIEPKRLNNVLISMRVNCLLKGLTQQELAALWRRDVAVSSQHDVVGGQGVCCDKKTEVALDDAALVFCQAFGIFPERDVARHVDLLRHPVVGAAGKVFFPRPFVLEGHQLVDIGLTVDDALVIGIDTAGIHHRRQGLSRQAGGLQGRSVAQQMQRSEIDCGVCHLPAVRAS